MEEESLENVHSDHDEDGDGDGTEGAHERLHLGPVLLDLDIGSRLGHAHGRHDDEQHRAPLEHSVVHEGPEVAQLKFNKPLQIC